MAQKWEEVGEGQGRQWKLTITTDGRAPQVFYGKSKAQIADQLAVAQEHATTAIDQLKNGIVPTPKPRREAPKPLDPGERMQMVSDIQNPSRVEKAVVRAIESVTGVSVAEIAAGKQQTAASSAAQFAAQTPDWYPTESNKRKLTRYMETQGRGKDDATVEDFSTAFQELMADGLLEVRPVTPQEPTQEPERIAPRSSTPARVSTGIRSGDVSGQTAPPSRRLKYTREQLATMGKDKYKHLMLTDSAELNRAEEFYATHPAA